VRPGGGPRHPAPPRRRPRDPPGDRRRRPGRGARAAVRATV